MKHLTLLLVVVLAFNSEAVTQATPGAASQATKIKTGVQRRGVGEKSRVKVKLRNKAEVKGYISRVEDASFDVTDKSTGQATSIPYADVEKIQGAGLSKGAKIGIVVGVAVAIVVVIFAAEFKANGY